MFSAKMKRLRAREWHWHASKKDACVAHRLYYAANADICKEASTQAYQNNSEKKKEALKKTYDANPEKKKETSPKW